MWWRRERELAKIKVEKADVDLMVSELLVSTSEATRRLREQIMDGGDLKSALRSFL